MSLIYLLLAVICFTFAWAAWKQGGLPTPIVLFLAGAYFLSSL